MIAALFVYERGPYAKIPDCDLWPAKRDARLYTGPFPVVAHPPCARWCRLAGLVESRWGHRKGDDGGTFAAALHAVRTFGGVLEHPAYSHAWNAFDLPTPHPNGGWQRGLCGGWSAHVEQGRYGHQAKKATWLYAVGCDLPSLLWGCTPDKATHLVSWCGWKASNDERPRLAKRASSATPAAFRDVLIAMARSASMPRRDLVSLGG